MGLRHSESFDVSRLIFLTKDKDVRFTYQAEIDRSVSIGLRGPQMPFLMSVPLKPLEKALMMVGPSVV